VDESTAKHRQRTRLHGAEGSDCLLSLVLELLASQHHGRQALFF
jgi:hypothetical protein